MEYDRMFGMETPVLNFFFLMREKYQMFCRLILFWCILFFFVVSRNMKYIKTSSHLCNRNRIRKQMTWLLDKALPKIIALSYLEIYCKLDCRNVRDKVLLLQQEDYLLRESVILRNVQCEIFVRQEVTPWRLVFEEL